MTALHQQAEPSSAGPGERAPRHLPLPRPRLGDTGGVLVALIVLVVVSSIAQPAFFTWPNLMNIVGANSVAMSLGIGSTFVIIAGGIDLSVVSMTAAAGMGLGLLLDSGAPTAVCVLGTLVVGAGLGVVNGVLISRLKISFLVVTLGMASIAASLALVVHNGSTVNVFAKPHFGPVHTFATGDVGSVPVILIFDVVLVLLAAGVLGYTRFGRSVFAVGSNAEAARLNGINVKNTTAIVYTLAGLGAGIGSVVQVGRLTGASPQIDPSLLNGVLAAVLIGGTSFSGGKGSIWGTVLGVLFLGVVQNIMTLADISSFWRQAVNGLLLILAVGLGAARWQSRRRRRPEAAVPLIKEAR
ncbi:ABC transporter permease [Streptomyces sp. NBC_01476]|uniref:ABC transporter permease n=1 Tax=Streptomyces sp. NBC_01476 TaxID=2903881 RepID=UPI002E332C7C|nr:ABC transporter permease [Streptomyces sp. NBC_01476]